MYFLVYLIIVQSRASCLQTSFTSDTLIRINLVLGLEQIVKLIQVSLREFLQYTWPSGDDYRRFIFDCQAFIDRLVNLFQIIRIDYKDMFDADCFYQILQNNHVRRFPWH